MPTNRSKHALDMVRGSRAARFGLDAAYLTGADAGTCVLVRIENEAGLDDLGQIAAVDGVGGAPIGPADPAAFLGRQGDARTPEAQAATDGASRRLRAAGKPAGHPTTNEAQQERRLADGPASTAVGTDVSIVARGATSLARSMRPRAARA